MKAARLHAYQEPAGIDYGKSLEVEEVDEPTASGPHDVVVRIDGAGLCRTDLHIVEGQWRSRESSFPTPSATRTRDGCTKSARTWTTSP